MNSGSIIKLVFLFIILVLLQVLVLNHIFFLGYATPFLYIYFIIKLPVALNRNLAIFLGFIMGLSIDFFCNTPGFNAAASTLAAFMRLPVQRLFFDKENFEHLEMSLYGTGAAFIKYAICIIVLHHFVLISIETFSFFNIGTILLRIFSSSILTFLLIYAIEGFSLKTQRTT